MLASSSCKNGFIFEGEGDCGTYYRIRFKYDYNIKFADAFAGEVNSVALYVFDENDVLVEEIATTDKQALSSGSFEIPLELDPGRYTLMAFGFSGGRCSTPTITRNRNTIQNKHKETALRRIVKRSLKTIIN